MGVSIGAHQPTINGDLMSKRSDKFTDEHTRPSIQPKNATQSRYIDALVETPKENGDDCFVFATGRAGTGKTWLASMVAADEYLAKNYQNIIICTPTMSCGEDMGALPGDIDEKFDPWIQNITKPIKERIGAEKYRCDWRKRIIAKPLQYCRGDTYDYTFVIIDEAQNMTVEQAKMITTRVGIGTKMVICGDTKQDDHKMIYRTGQKEESGLSWLVNEILRQNEGGIEIINFTSADSVRSGACKKMLGIHDRAE